MKKGWTLIDIDNMDFYHFLTLTAKVEQQEKEQAKKESLEKIDSLGYI